MKQLLTGIEWEFFIEDNEALSVVPAYKGTYNLDGNPFIGELRTQPMDSDKSVFELMRLKCREKEELAKAKLSISPNHSAIFNLSVLKDARKDRRYTDSFNKDVLDEKSIYPKGKTGTILKKGQHKASLQLNFSVTEETKDDKGNSNFKSDVFNYFDIIALLDKEFAEEIKMAGRKPGVYALKDGKYGKRVEYRSLPSSIDLLKLSKLLSHIKI